MLNLVAGMVHFALVLCHIYLQGTVKTYSAYTLECQNFKALKQADRGFSCIFFCLLLMWHLDQNRY